MTGRGQRSEKDKKLIRSGPVIWVFTILLCARYCTVLMDSPGNYFCGQEIILSQFCPLFLGRNQIAIASLYDEVWNYSVKEGFIKIPLFCQIYKVGSVQRCVFKQFNFNFPDGGGY